MKLARRVTNLAESATLAVAARAARLRAEGVDLIAFGAGEPDFTTPAHIIDAAVSAMRDGQTGYPKPASGIPSAKRAVCEKFAKQNALTYAPEQVMVTTGGKMAVSLAIHALIEPGDEVVIPRPYWVSYPEIVKLAGGVPVFVSGSPQRDFKLTSDDLSAVLTDRTRVVLFNSPSNPSGVTYDPDEVRAIAGVLEGRDLIVISDEIYDRLLYDGQKTLSYAAVGERAYAQTLTINAVSKTYAMTGWRLGYAGGPVELIRAMSKLQSQSTSGAATFSQHALAAALTCDQGVVESMRAEFEQRRQIMYERLIGIEGVQCPRPTGAFYCFPDVRRLFAKAGVDGSVAFAEKLLQEVHVAVVPGAGFGMDGHVRLSFALDREQIERGLDRIEAFVRDAG